MIADAETEEDLASAVERAANNRGAWIGVGSGALAKPIARFLAPARGTVPTVAGVGLTYNHTALGHGARVLLVSGSAHTGNIAQAEILATTYAVARHEVNISAPIGAAILACETLHKADAVMLLLEQKRHDSRVALRAICDAAVHVFNDGGVNRVFVTGGETAFALCRALDIESLQFLAELEPELSLSKTRAGNRNVVFAIKPGGFGERETWVRAWRALQEAS
jgi:uncharacterized protein YgbK (DUF1537 family)